MAGTILRNRIRFAVDNILNRIQGFEDELTGQRVRFWQAEDTTIEIAIFNNGVIAADLTNFDSFTVELKDPDHLDGSALFSVVLLKTDPGFDGTVTQGDWDAGTDQHLLYELAFTDTNIELQGLKSRVLTLFVWGTTGDTPARRIMLAKSDVTLQDSGYGDIGAITVVPVGARIHNNKLQVLNETDGLYYDVTLFGPSDSVQVKCGNVGEA